MRYHKEASIDKEKYELQKLNERRKPSVLAFMTQNGASFGQLLASDSPTNTLLASLKTLKTLMATLMTQRIALKTLMTTRLKKEREKIKNDN